MCAVSVRLPTSGAIRSTAALFVRDAEHCGRLLFPRRLLDAERACRRRRRSTDSAPTMILLIEAELSDDDDAAALPRHLFMPPWLFVGLLVFGATFHGHIRCSKLMLDR